MIKKGDRVAIKPFFQDEGDNDFIWIACDNEEKGRVTIKPINSNMRIIPTDVIEVRMLDKIT